MTLEGKQAITADHKHITCVDVGTTQCPGESDTLENFAHCVTETGVLVVFNSSRVLERWVDLKMDQGTCIDVSPSLVVCGGTNGIVRFFEPGTLKYIGTLPKPDPLFIDIQTGELSAHVKTDAILYPSVVSVRKLTPTPDSTYLVVTYSNKHMITWDLADLKKAKRMSSSMYHSDCVWGVKVFVIYERLLSRVTSRG
jgi:WD40 repeat protein